MASLVKRVKFKNCINKTRKNNQVYMTQSLQVPLYKWRIINHEDDPCNMFIFVGFDPP